MSYYEDGYSHGVNAGSWVIDGNTSAETAQAILRGIADGDPEVLEMQPSPLSGEWAGESIGELIDDYAELDDEAASEACDEYERGFSEGFWFEVERSAKAVA